MKELLIATFKQFNSTQKVLVCSMAAKGMISEDIVLELKRDYNVEATMKAVMQTRKYESERISKMRKDYKETRVIKPALLVEDADFLLKRMLKRAIADNDRMERLDRKYRRGEVDNKDFKRALETFYQLPAKDIINIRTHFTKLADAAKPPTGAKAASQANDKELPTPSIGFTPEQQAQIDLAVRSGAAVHIQTRPKLVTPLQ